MTRKCHIYLPQAYGTTRKRHRTLTVPRQHEHIQVKESALSSSARGLQNKGAQWLSGRVLDSRWRGGGLEPHQHHCVVSISKNINPSLVLTVQPRKTRPFITERLLIGRKESNQIKWNSKRLQKYTQRQKLNTSNFVANFFGARLCDVNKPYK